MERKTIPIIKACELVGVSRRTIYNWLSSGKIEYSANGRRRGANFRRHALARSTQHRSAAGRCSVAGGRPHSRLTSVSFDEKLTSSLMDDTPELRLLFHRLNNQLGIILAHAELLEARAPDEHSRARAAQVVASTIDALSTAQDIRRQAMPSGDPP